MPPWDPCNFCFGTGCHLCESTGWELSTDEEIAEMLESARRVIVGLSPSTPIDPPRIVGGKDVEKDD